MDRRNFLKSTSAAGIAAAMPLPLKAMSLNGVSASASYSRYMYGLGVFHARTKASLSAMELASKLSLSSNQVHAMMNEMVRSGVVRSTSQAGVVEAISQHMKPKAQVSLTELHQRFMDITEDEADTKPIGEIGEEELTEFDNDDLA